MENSVKRSVTIDTPSFGIALHIKDEDLRWTSILEEFVNVLRGVGYAFPDEVIDTFDSLIESRTSL